MEETRPAPTIRPSTSSSAEIEQGDDARDVVVESRDERGIVFPRPAEHRVHAHAHAEIDG
jgi:hypothetical protein